MIKGAGNRKRKCKHCQTEKRAHEGFIVGVNWVCSEECGYNLSITALNKTRERSERKARQSQEKKQKSDRARHRNNKKSVKKITAWQQQLRSLVQQYVMTVKDKGAKCSTCSNPVATEAGHYLSVGSRPELQFELTNIHPQCHECNVYKSSNKAEYDKFILAKYGQEHFDKLNSNDWPDLKELFPHWTDYENEIKRYRKLLRDNGIKPRI